MNFNVLLNAHIEPCTFPVVAVINGIPCIPAYKPEPFDITVRVYHGIGGGQTQQHDTPEGRVQEVSVDDIVVVLAKKHKDAPIMLDAYYVDRINEDQVFTHKAIL